MQPTRKLLPQLKTEETQVSQEHETYEARVARTRKRFILSLDERLDAILSAARGGADADPVETQPRKVHRMMHDMAGNAAMLELSEVEDSIRKGLGVAEKADADGVPMTDADVAAIEAAVEETRKVAAVLQEHVAE